MIKYFINKYFNQDYEVLNTIEKRWQGLLELLFIGQIVKRFSNIMLLRPGHWGDFWNPPYTCTDEHTITGVNGADRAGPRPTRKCCVLLRPDHWANLPTKGTPEVADRSLSRLCFLMRKFLKNERRACDHRVWLLEWPQAPLVDLTAKSDALANLKIQWTRIENLKIWGLRARPTLR